ncbi:prolactin-7D1-like isoform X1, partial [Sigmodon hispidus]
MNVYEADVSEVSLKDLFVNANILAENITKLATDMRLEFILDIHKEMKMSEIFNSCHTLPIKTPETEEEVRNTT